MNKICLTNYKTLIEKIKEELNKWRNIPHSWIERFHIVKMSVLPCLIAAILIIIPVSYFVDISKPILKFIRRGKTQNSQHIIEEEQS